MQNPYHEFTKRLTLLINKNPRLITTTLSNIFTMRLIGNKTHGDLAEIAIAEFINQYMYDYRSTHVGKDLYRAKSHEEDITIKNELTEKEFPVSLKAYGKGPLQLSTDKMSGMFTLLSQHGKSISEKKTIEKIYSNQAFSSFHNVNILPLIYDEKTQLCNILVFNSEKARQSTYLIKKEIAGSGRKHPVYKFLDKAGNYICEVRYGGTDANALQRGLWTNTMRASSFFESVTGGWISYSHNEILVSLFSHALVCERDGHQDALSKIKENIESIRRIIK